MSFLDSDLKFYYLVDSGEAFDEEEMNEVSFLAWIAIHEPRSNLNLIGKLKKHIFRKLTRKMAKLAKTILKHGNVESYGITEQYTLQNKQHLIDALSLLDDPTQIRIYISASTSSPMIQLADTQKLDTIHQDVSVS
jgi:inorganic triphosphatase YgiF